MHDLINDLAQSVTGNTYIRLEDYQCAELPPQLLHFSCLIKPFKKFGGFAQVQGLRTFWPVHDYQYFPYGYRSPFSFSDMFPRFRRLRALSLSRYRINMVLDSIGDLKHLRFLNLAATDIEKLPNAISKCLNLQTLILANCEKLVEWPEDMRLLVNLQYLDIQSVGNPFIGKLATVLKDVENVSVVVDKIHGSELELLAQLQLCHSLNIIGLGDTDVVAIERAKRLRLYDIENLTLEWSGRAECSDDELNKFAQLQPHTNTKQLSIKGYKGTRFPNWLGDSAFSNMESLSLAGCKNCFSLPPLGQLTALKKLHISGMDGITVIGEEFYGDASTSKPFQALEELEFSHMAKWAIWNTQVVVFPSIKSLEIGHCNYILSFPEGGLAAPNLKTLKIEYCSKMKSLPASMHTQLPLLTHLYIIKCPEIECFPEGGLQSSLERLYIILCSKMRICQTNWGLQTLPSLKVVGLSGFEDTLFPEEGLLPTTLQKLSIYCFRNLESLNEKGLQHLCSLQYLEIQNCLNLKCLPQQNFSSSLLEMHIRDCSLVESLPEGFASSLSSLSISGCPKLAERVEREKGED